MDELIHQLKRWQGRERFFRFAWGLARWSAVVLGGLATCCLVDWMIDRYRDTPMLLRILMTFGQLALYSATAVWFLYRLRTPTIDVLAGKAESAFPEFDHRIVTALQLNRPTAKTQGMSPQLIGDVTREAVALAARHDLAKLAETDRLRRAAIVLAPLALVALAIFAFNPKLVLALVARQCLLPADIPRSVALVPDTAKLWPSGDPVRLTFRVSGKFTESSVGVATVEPEGLPAETYDLKFVERIDDGTARFAADYPPSSVPFAFRARLHDGRTRVPGEVRFEPRPVVKTVSAWLRLPTYVDPDGQRVYERFQPEGEVTALPGCGLRVAIEASKPLKSASLVLLQRTAAGVEEPLGEPTAMALDADRTAAYAVAAIPAKAVGYRVLVVDDNDFANLNPPRRGIGIAPDDPPRVNLLPEILKDPRDPGPIDDYEVTGMPLVLGGRVQIGYAARSPLGLARAFIMYRVNDSETWTPYPLAPTVADLEKTGKFLPDLGVFENSGEDGKVDFYRFPSPDIESEPPGLEAGGRYNFETAALKKTVNGRETKLEVGDRVEFHVAVFDRNPDPNRPPGRSESRIKAVVTQSQWEDWNRQRDQSRERLKQLEERQRGVFGGPAPAAGNPFRKP